MRALIVLSLGLSVAACFRLDVAGDEYPCASKADCLEQYQCVEGTCRAVLSPQSAVPSAPDLSKPVPYYRSVRLGWGAPQSGHPIIGYRVYQATSADGPFSSATATIEGTSAIVEGLSEKSRYFFRVTALNQVGEGTPSATSEGVEVKTWQSPGSQDRRMFASGIVWGRQVCFLGGVAASGDPLGHCAKRDALSSEPRFEPVPRDSFTQRSSPAAAWLTAPDQGFVYLSGGEPLDGSGQLLGDTVFAPLNSDGSMGTWSRRGPTFPGRRHHALVTYRNNLIVVGGETASGPTNEVLVARLSPDGSLEDSSWRSTSPLPFPVSHPSVVVHDDVVTVIGGIQDGAAAKGVLRAVLDEQGRVIGDWTGSVYLLPQPLVGAATLVVGDSLIVMGGLTPAGGESILTANGTFFGTTLVGRFDAVGDARWIDPVNVENKLPRGRAGHALATDGDLLFVLYGREEGGGPLISEERTRLRDILSSPN